MSALPKLSIRLHGGLPPSKCVELAVAAEAAGLDGVWFAENAFGRGILPSAAACAVATNRVHISAGVFNPFSRHPTMMGMEIAALDELCGGRASIGIGAGIGSQVRKIGHDPQRPLVALRDALTILRGLLNGETVEYDGSRFSAHGVRLDNLHRKGIPIYLAGRGDLTVKLAGAAADGLIISNMCSSGFSKRAATMAEEARRKSGRSAPIEIVQYVPCEVDADRERAIAAAKRAVGAMVPNYWGLAEKIESARLGLLCGTGIEAQEFAEAATRLRAAEDATVVLDQRYVDAFAVAGTADDCLAAAARYAEASVTELALTFEGPTAVSSLASLGAAARTYTRT